MSFETALSERLPLRLDDQPLDAILYGAPGEPSSLDSFAPIRTTLEKIERAMRSGRVEAALPDLRKLDEQGAEIPLPLARVVADAIASTIPNCSRPLVPESVVPFEPILGAIFTRAEATGDHELANVVGLTLARTLESRGQFEEAAGVFTRLLRWAQSCRDRLEEAQHANNLGYELTQAGRYAEAENHCERATRLFAQLGAGSRANNARANLLIARFARLGWPEARTLESQVAEVDAVYAAESDERRRKTLILLAQIHEHEERLARAVKLTKEALRVSAGVPTQHVAEDEIYLTTLKQRMERKRSTRSHRSRAA